MASRAQAKRCASCRDRIGRVAGHGLRGDGQVLFWRTTVGALGRHDADYGLFWMLSRYRFSAITARRE
jgi:hypothetical protein